MNAKTIFILIIALSAVVLMGGCVSNDNTVKTQEDAAGTTQDIVSGVDEVSDTLNDLDTSIG